MGRLDELYKNLSSDDINIVSESLENRTLFKRIYELMCLKEINKNTIKVFLEKYHLTSASFNYLVAYYISSIATEQQLSRIKYYKHYRKIRNSKYYQKIIQRILDEKDIDQKKKLLQEYSDVYSINAFKFGEKTNQMNKIKETNIVYQQMLAETKKASKSIVTEETKLIGLTHIKEKFLAVDRKINQKEYHLQKELKELQDAIYYMTKKLSDKEVKLYKNELLKYYDCILNRVVFSYCEDPTSFNVLTYYYITDVEPHYLLKRTMDSGLSLYGKLLKKTTPAHNHSFKATYVPTITPTYFQNIGKYSYQGVTLNAEDLVEIYHQMDVCLPKNEFVFMEYVKEYIRKNKEQLLNEKKLIK